jgi:hypothetical protein
MQKVLKVWFHDDDEPRRPNMTAMDSETAAELYAQHNYDEPELPESHFVNVRLADGTLERFEVHVAYEPTFLAARLHDAKDK